MSEKAGGEILVYIGTYAQGGSDGIYTYRLDHASGALERISAVPAGQNPSFVAIAPNRRHLYAVNEIGQFEGQPTGAVGAFSVDPHTGRPAFLNQQSSHGSGPCFVSVDGTGQYALAANYGSGSVCMLPITADGKLEAATDWVQHHGSSVNPQRQEGPHAHSIITDPANHYALSADLGLDKIMVYRMDLDNGKLIPNEEPSAPLPPGSGPRHLAFHPNGRYCYVITELANTMVAFHYEGAHGTLRQIQSVSTLPHGFTGTSHCAEVLVHPSGRFLYGSNRGHDSIAIFGIDPETGRMSPAGHQPVQGKNPRSFGIDPTGTFLLAANQDTNNVVIFHIDEHSGGLTPAGHTVEVPKPVCVKMIPMGG